MILFLLCLKPKRVCCCFWFHNHNGLFLNLNEKYTILKTCFALTLQLPGYQTCFFFKNYNFFIIIFFIGKNVNVINFKEIFVKFQKNL